MSEPTKKKAAKGRAPAARRDESTTLADHACLSLAVDGFVRDNCNFESSYALNAALDDANRSPDLQTLFAVPLQHKLFAMESALRWVLFLHVAPGRAAQEGDAPFSAGAAFSAPAALDLIAQIYDVGLQEAAWDHFEPDEPDEDDEGDDGGGDAEDEGV